MLKHQYFGHLMLEKIEDKRRRGQQRMRWLDGITDSMDHEFEQAPGDDEGQGSVACCSPWGHKKSDTIERLNDNLVIIVDGFVQSCSCGIVGMRV